MRYRQFGRTGLQVSVLSFGAMTFGEGMGSITKVDDTGADALVGRALDAGINLFDTANTYAGGRSEEMLGRALGARRDDVLIATKVGFGAGGPANDGGLSYRHVIDSCERSLRRLGTDRIDLFQVHKPDARTPFEETARALDDLVRRGLVRYVGFCNFAAWQAALAVAHQRSERLASFVSAQMYYSLLGRGIEAEIAPLVQHLGLAVLPWSPLAGGFLTGKYTDNAAADEDRRSTMPFPPVEPELGDECVRELRAVAEKHGVSVVEVALAWLLSRPWVTSVIVGASKVEQLEQNLGAGDLVLDADDVARLDAVSDPARHAEFWWPELFDAPITTDDIAAAGR